MTSFGRLAFAAALAAPIAIWGMAADAGTKTIVDTAKQAGQFETVPYNGGGSAEMMLSPPRTGTA